MADVLTMQNSIRAIAKVIRLSSIEQKAIVLWKQVLAHRSKNSMIGSTQAVAKALVDVPDNSAMTNSIPAVAKALVDVPVPVQGQAPDNSAMINSIPAVANALVQGPGQVPVPVQGQAPDNSAMTNSIQAVAKALITVPAQAPVDNSAMTNSIQAVANALVQGQAPDNSAITNSIQAVANALIAANAVPAAAPANAAAMTNSIRAVTNAFMKAMKLTLKQRLLKKFTVFKDYGVTNALAMANRLKNVKPSSVMANRLKNVKPSSVMANSIPEIAKALTALYDIPTDGLAIEENIDGVNIPKKHIGIKKPIVVNATDKQYGEVTDVYKKKGDFIRIDDTIMKIVNTDIKATGTGEIVSIAKKGDTISDPAVVAPAVAVVPGAAAVPAVAVVPGVLYSYIPADNIEVKKYTLDTSSGKYIV